MKAWVHKIIVQIPDETIDEAGSILSKHLDSYGEEPGQGLGIVGGDKWWRVRGKALEGEWIEVSVDGEVELVRAITIPGGEVTYILDAKGLLA
jgi:hypothetical protein